MMLTMKTISKYKYNINTIFVRLGLYDVVAGLLLNNITDLTRNKALVQKNCIK